MIPVEDVDEEDEIADVTEVGVTLPREDGDEAMDEDDEETEDHGPVCPQVKQVTPRLRSLEAVVKAHHVDHNHLLHRRNHGVRRLREEDDDEDEDEHHRSGETIEEDDDESLDEKDEVGAKRPQAHDDEDDGDDDEDGSGVEKSKKFRRNDEAQHTGRPLDPDEYEEDLEEEVTEDNDDQVHNRRRRRPRSSQQDRQHRSDDIEEDGVEDGDDEEEVDDDASYGNKDECTENVETKRHKGAVVPQPVEVALKDST